MLELYKDPALLNDKLYVIFLGEVGADEGGLTKDLFSLFWCKAMENFFQGESAVVPHLPLHRQSLERELFVSIGRILAHTIALLKYIPARLSRVTLMCLAFDSSQVTDEILLEDFR